MRFKIFACLLMLTILPVTGFAQTAAYDPMSPANIAKNAANLTPQQRQQFLDQYNKMSPAQRQAITNQAQAAWQQLAPEQKESLKAEAVKQWGNLSPQDKQALATKAQQQWQQMSPQDKQQLTNQFQDYLKNNMPAQQAR